MAAAASFPSPQWDFGGLSSASDKDKREGLRDGARHGAAFEVGTI